MMSPNFWDLLWADSISRWVFFPTLAAIPLLFLRRVPARWLKAYGLLVSLVELALVLANLASFWSSPEQVRRDPVLTWIQFPGLTITYDVGVDGISAPLVTLTALLLPLVILGSSKGIEQHWAGYLFCLFLLTTGILGAFVALDLFLFYVFWELMLIPMYFIIGIWGGERRIYAAVKFFLFTMAGSLLMLVAILWLGWSWGQIQGSWGFRLDDLLRLDLPVGVQYWLFLAFALAFAIKVPMFPLHTWLPDAHVEAPTGGSVILAGVLLKLGTYGFLRFAFPLFPHAADRFAGWILALAAVGILYGALVAWRQTDLKKLVAYSSVAHLGFVMLGLGAFHLVAWQGALLQMVNHGLTTGGLFLLVGMLYDRRHTKRFEDFGGLAAVLPWFAVVFVFTSLASVGLPGLNGFVGEFLVLLGTFARGYRWFAVLGAVGVILAAVYILKMVEETLWGPIRHEVNRQLPDLSFREAVLMLPLCLLMLWIGLQPKPFLEPSRPALQAVLNYCQDRLRQEAPNQPVLRAASASDSPALGIPGSTSSSSVAEVQP